MIVSLLAFHRFLIAAAIAFCLGYAVWEARDWMETREVGALVIACVFVLLAAGLGVYLSRLERFLGYGRGEGPPPR